MLRLRKAPPRESVGTIYKNIVKGTHNIHIHVAKCPPFLKDFLMRKARMKFPKSLAAGYYHCVSRVVNREFLFKEAEKDRFVEIMREYEAFCEVRVLSFCLMSDHFHILVEVPKRPESLPTSKELIEKLDTLGCVPQLDQIKQRLESMQGEAQAKAREAFLESFFKRMWDVSWFNRLVKQRFTAWYNSRSGRRGTLWEERFKSVLVEGSGEALVTMASYIDLNPVRAGLVKDPGAYRWSGYGEAMAGKKLARRGIQFLVTALQQGKETTPGESMKLYRKRVHAEAGEGRDSGRGGGKTRRGALSQHAVEKALKAKERLPVTDYVRCRVRYFSDGAIFGSRQFVEEMFGAMRSQFDPNRKTGARRMKGVSQELYSLRDLQVRVFGKRGSAEDRKKRSSAGKDRPG